MSGERLRVGVDVASISRVHRLAQRRPRFADRVYTPQERRDCASQPRRWASRWAAKEAVRKLEGAAGRPLPRFRDIEIVIGDGGEPQVRLAGILGEIALSLSDEGDLAVAVVVASGGPGDGPGSVPVGMRLPSRPPTGHKGSFGTVVVVAGARHYSGAPVLAALGAARGGAGLVRLCVPAEIYLVVAAHCLEPMTDGLPDGGKGVLSPEAVPVVLGHLEKASALVIGPGLGRDPATERALLEIIDRARCPVVIDADGLNIAAARGLDWRQLRCPAVITPHPAEMGRLLGCDTADVQADRVGVAAGFAARRGVVVVLKGSGTVVAAPDGRVHVDGHQVVALATGGTGDVLAGLLGAFLAQGLDGYEAAVAAVTVHAQAGATVERVRGRAGALAGDLIEVLPAAQERIRRVLETRR